MNLFNNGLFKFLEKTNPSQINEQLDTKALINYCQYALEVQMYASESYNISNEGPLKLNELDLPSVSTSIDIPQISSKAFSHNHKDLCNIICLVHKESNNLPETLKNLKEKMKQNMKEKDKLTMTRTKYYGVYQQDSFFIAYFEKIPGQKLDKIGEFKNPYEAAKAYDHYLIRKDLHHKKKSKDDPYFPLNFPSPHSKSRSRSSDSRKNRGKSNNNNNNPSLRKSNESSNKRYRNHDYIKMKESKYYSKRDADKKNSPLYKPTHNKEITTASQSNNINYNSNNTTNKSTNLKPINSGLPNNSGNRDSFGSNNSLSNKKKNMNNLFSNNLYPNYQYPNNQNYSNNYANKSTSGYYMNDNQNSSYGYGQGYYSNNSSYYPNYQPNSINNIYNQGNLYHNFVQSSPLMNSNFSSNNQFSAQNSTNLPNSNDITNVGGYKRNFNHGYNANSYSNNSYNLGGNTFTNGYNQFGSSFDEEGKNKDLITDDKKNTKGDLNNIGGKKEGDEKKINGEFSTIVAQSDLSQNINY